MTMTIALVDSADDLRIAPLDADDVPAFRGFTYPRLVGALLNPTPLWIAIGAWIAGQPAGLALGHIDEDGKADLLSVFVDRSRRGVGVGRRLIESLMDRLQARGIRSVSARIAGNNPSRPALARALAKLGWPSLSCVEIRVLGHAGAMAQEGGRWKGVRGLLADGGVVFDRWTDFDAQDWQAFDALVAQAGLPRASRDYLMVEGLEPKVSVVLRRHGVPVGWVVGRHAIVPLADGRRVSGIGYSSAYVESSLARRGVLIAGFWHAFTRQADAFGPESIAVYQTPTPRMIALSRRRFAPLALETREVFESVMRFR